MVNRGRYAEWARDRCNVCLEKKPRTSEFYSYKSNSADDLDYKCRDCAATGVIRAKYGVDSKRYLEATHCEICFIEFKKSNGRTNKCVDHDHATDKFRGIICNGCNVALGAAKDSISTLSKMITYLEER